MLKRICTLAMPPCDKARALAFLKNNLQFTDENVSLLEKDRVQFLNVYVKKFYETQPFTNFNSHLWKVTSAKEGGGADGSPLSGIPVDALLKQLESNKGGACFVAAYGSCLFLTQLGIESYVTWTYTENRPGFENGHFVFIVKNLKSPGDLYLVDFGTRISPLNHPVPLHVLSQEGQASEDYPSFYMFNRFVRKGDEILRYTGKLGTSEPYLFYRIKTNPPTCEASSPDGDRILFSKFPAVPQRKDPKPEGATKHKPGSFWFAQFHIVGFPGGKVSVLRNKEFMLQEEVDGEIVRKNIGNKEEYLDIIYNYYPQYDKETVQFVIDGLWDRVINPPMA